MDELGLNNHHQLVLLSYMKFAKYMRSQNLKQIQHSFEDAETGLFEDTYTKEEVKDLLMGLSKIITCDVETELISFSHNNVLMLKQLFKQAEKWYLRLEIDVSELQNQDELEVIKLLESHESQFQLKPDVGKESVSLEESSIQLLKMEIERLKEENVRLSNIIQDAEDRADLYKEEKNKLGENLLNAQKEILNYKTLMENHASEKNSGEDPESIKKLADKLREVENLLSVNVESLKENENINEKLKKELMSTQDKVKQVEAQLQLAEGELEKKFSETKAYANMKQILIKKNETIKSLREALSKHEPQTTENSEDED